MAHASRSNSFRCPYCASSRLRPRQQCSTCHAKLCDHEAHTSRMGWTLCRDCVEVERTNDAIRAALAERSARAVTDVVASTAEMPFGRECFAHGAPAAGHCGGRLVRITPHGHALCERHKQKLNDEGLLDLGRGFGLQPVVSSS